MKTENLLFKKKYQSFQKGVSVLLKRRNFFKKKVETRFILKLFQFIRKECQSYIDKKKIFLSITAVSTYIVVNKMNLAF